MAILSYRWNLRIRHHQKENQCHQKEAYGNPAFFQICAFGLPAIQTVITLVAKLVDADELLGLYLTFGSVKRLTFQF